ncbi:unnamed protein product [Trifolium pratense]|uniref:Uncharacterized protein n=1 Tax=Trifolium pratense TaxID=57577 RepID=A0ACB0M9E6_TRIPR|nr:unnamed protein product [Trifolium pratense]
MTYIIFLRQHTTQLKHTNTNQERERERENKEQNRETKQNKQNPESSKSEFNSNNNKERKVSLDRVLWALAEFGKFLSCLGFGSERV